MSKGKRASVKPGRTRGGAKRARVTPPNQGKGKATASWNPLKNIQKQRPVPQLEIQARQASSLPRPCVKSFLAELKWKIINTPASTYNQPRKRGWLPNASHMVYSFWDGRCFQMPLADCQDEIRGPEFLDSNVFQDPAQPDDELYVLELLHSIDYAFTANPKQGSPEVAPHALELVRRLPADLPDKTPKGAQTPAAALATEQKQPITIPATPVPTSQTPGSYTLLQPDENTDPQAQSCKVLDPFANQPLEPTPDEDFLAQLSETWKEIQEDPERAARQRGFDQAFIAAAFDMEVTEVEPLAKKPLKAKAVEEDPEEHLDDDFLAEVFASAKEEVAPAPQPPATPPIYPFLKEPPARSSLHMYFMEPSATLTALKNSIAVSTSAQQQESPCINLDVLEAMDFPQGDYQQLASQTPTSAALTLLQSGTAATASAQQQESPCIGLSIQDAANLAAELVADFPAKYQPQMSQPSVSARTMCYSDIVPFKVPEQTQQSPILCQGGTQPPIACYHPVITPPFARPAKRAKRRQLPTAPSVGPGLLAPLADGPPLPLDCTPAAGTGNAKVRHEAAALAAVPSKRGQACAKRKVADAAEEAAVEDVESPTKRARGSAARLPTVAHESLQLRWDQRGMRSPQARQQHVCSPMPASTAEEAWSNLLVV